MHDNDSVFAHDMHDNDPMCAHCMHDNDPQAISTADESQHTSLTVFTLAQILYALLKPHAGCAAPRVTSL